MTNSFLKHFGLKHSGVFSAKRIALLLLSVTLLTAGSGRLSAQALDPKTLPSVAHGNTNVSGVFLSPDGVLAAPYTDDTGDWIVSFEGERYPATVVASLNRYSMVLLKIVRQKPFPVTTLAQRPFPSTAKLKLMGVDSLGNAVQTEATFLQIRRKVPEQSLDGSYFEVNPLGTVPPPGSLLIDEDTGTVYGMLVSPTTDNGAHLVLFGSSILDRVASEEVVTGSAAATNTGGGIELAGGGDTAAQVRLLEFRAAATYNDAVQARAVQSWRTNTGFWINAMTSPDIRGTHCYFGSRNGILYSVDLNIMQREWVFQNEQPVFFPPTIGTSQICVASGNLKFGTWEEDDTSIGGLLFGGTTVRHAIFDEGIIACVDAASGAFKWDYHTRFVSQPVIVDNRVLFGGMGILGVLDLSTGKEIWTHDLARDNDSPTYITIAGSDGKVMWTLGIPTKLTGENTKEKPFRLEQRGDAKVECYTLDHESKPLWNTAIRSAHGGPALCTAMLMDPAQTTCYGATAKDVFAVDASTGQLRWQMPVFDQQFAGSLACGESLIFAGSTDDKLYAVSAVDGRVLWVFEDARAPLCVPLVQDGVVYVGSLDTWIYALEARTGRLIWKYETQGKVCGQPRIVGNNLYAMTDDGRLTEIQLP